MKRSPRTILFAVLVFSLTGCAVPSLSPSESPRSVTVARVVDGDTVEVRPTVYGETDVRLIGMDTPERFDPSGEQPYAEVASRYTERRLENQRVMLRFDVEKKDDYGRVLAYLYLPGNSGETFNETLVREGYAQVATFPPNVRHVEQFEEAQRKAREARRGIWGLPVDEKCRLTDRGNGIGGC